MPADPAAPDEDARQLKLLNTAVGVRGSGMARYGAAMYFFRQGRLSAEMLEIYRICCKQDAENPMDLAEYKGVPTSVVE